MNTKVFSFLFATLIAVTAGLFAQGGNDCSNATPAMIGDNFADNAGYADQWYTYVATMDGKITVSSCDSASGIDTYVEVYTDGCFDTFLGSDEQSCGTSAAKFTFPVNNGQTYYIVWRGWATDQAYWWQLSESAAMQGEVCTDPFTAVVGINAADHLGGVDQWYSYTPGSNGRVKVTTCDSTAINTIVTVYSDCQGTVIGSNDDFCLNQSEFEFDVLSGITYYIKWGSNYTAASYDWYLTFSVPPIGESCINPMSGNLGVNFADHAGSVDQWYVYTATMDGMIVLSSCDSTAEDTWVEVWDGCGMIMINSNDNECGSQAKIQFASYTGYTYFINWSSIYTSGSYSWALLEKPLQPVVTIDPPDATGFDEITLVFDAKYACNNGGSANSLLGADSVGFNSSAILIGESQHNWNHPVYFDGTGANMQRPILMPLGDSTYSITFTPSDYYGTGAAEIRGISMSFNNGIDWSEEGLTFATFGCDDMFIPLQVTPGLDCTSPIAVDTGIHVADHTGDVQQWYVYTAKMDGILEVSSCGLTATDTWVEIYADTCEGEHLGYSDDYCDLQSKMIVLTTTGQKFYIHWGTYDAPGSYNWSLSERASIPGELCSLAKPAFAGTNVADHTQHTDQWYTYTATMNGKMTLSTCGLTSENTWVEVWDGCNAMWLGGNDNGCEMGNQSEANIEISLGQTYYIKWSGIYTAGVYNWTLTEGPALPGEFCSNPLPATLGMNSCPDSVPGSQWFSYTPVISANVNLSTCGLTDVLTSVRVYEDCNGGLLDYADQVCNGQTALTVFLNAGITYYIELIGYSFGTYNWELSDMSLLYNKTNVTTYLGTDGNIDITVDGGQPPYTYLWTTADGSGLIPADEDQTGLTAGIYEVVVTDNRAITATMKITISQPYLPVTDFDGINYNTVFVGNAIWMAANLRSMHYADGRLIPGNYMPDNDTMNVQDYGRLYTWAAAMDSSLIEMVQGVCPTGYHLPSDKEWQSMEVFLGMYGGQAAGNEWRGTDQGGMLKATGTLMDTGLWEYPNTLATNSSGFNAVPAGFRDEYGTFSITGQEANFWTSSRVGSTISYFRRLASDMGGIYRTYKDQGQAFSIRCVKDYDVDLALIGQSGVKDACNPGTDTLILVLSNAGKDTIYDFKISYYKDAVPIAADSVTMTLLPGDTINYTFSSLIDLNTPDYQRRFKIDVNIMADGDQNSGNDHIYFYYDVFGNYTDKPGWTSYNTCNGLIHPSVWSSAEDNDGNMWFGGFYGVQVYDGTNWTYPYSHSLSNYLPEDSVIGYAWEMIKDSKGNLWIGNDYGTKKSVVKYDGTNFTTHFFDQSDGQPECMYEDSKGNMWFGLYGAGIWKFDGTTWTKYTTDDGLLEGHVNSIAEDHNGNLLFSTFAGISSFDGATWSEYEVNGNTGMYISEIFMDSKNNLWLTAGRPFYRFDGADWFEYGAPEGIEGSGEDIQEDRFGNIWFGGNAGLYKFDGTNWTNYSAAGGLVKDQVYTIAISRDGDIWAGTYQGGLSRLDMPAVVWLDYTVTDVSTFGAKDGAIDLFVGGDFPPFTIRWSNGAVTEDLTGLAAGIYHVTVTDNNSFTASKTITVKQPGPCDLNPDFAFDVAGNMVDFTTLTSGKGYFWDFGDGTSANEPNPSHLYAFPDIYHVCLTVFDSVLNCSEEICYEVTAGTVECAAAFSFIPDQDAITTIQFLNESSGSASKWHWDFGDGSFSDKSNPVHKYNEPGVYEVCLNILDILTGCQAEKCHMVDAGFVNLFADFSYIVNPDTREVIFTDYSSGVIDSRYWTFGDGTYHIGGDTNHIYPIPGVYEVCLMVMDETSGDLAEICQEIRVGEPSCDLDANFLSFVDPALNSVTFADRSTGTVNAWFWNFGDGTTSSRRNPIHVYKNAGIYEIRLSIRDNIKDCSDFIVKQIQVGDIDCQANFTVNVNMKTSNITLVNNSSPNIENYFWSFGDGNYSTDFEPVHQFDTPGLYKISLTVLDSTGLCMDLAMKQVQVGTIECNARFSYFIDSISNTAQFTSHLIGDATSVIWFFGDGSTSTKLNPKHVFAAPGFYPVGLNTFNNITGCMDYYEEVVLVGSSGIDCRAGFIYSANQLNRNIAFTNRSTGDISEYIWDFDDDSLSFLKNPVHNYTKGGYYYVCLTVVNSFGISNTSCDFVQVETDLSNDCLAKFIYSTDSTARSASFTDRSFGKPVEWLWDFGDKNTSVERNPSHLYNEAGINLVKMAIINSGGCKSTAYAMVNISAGDQGLYAGFGYSVDSINLKADSYPVDFIGVSLGDSKKFKWSFGDGSPIDSTSLRPTHTYTSPGIYEVCFTVINPVTSESSTSCDSLYVGVTEPSSVIMLTDQPGLSVYPNPFKDVTLVKYYLPNITFADLSVYDIMGRKIKALRRATISAGIHEVILERDNLKAGLYYIVLTTQEGKAALKVIVE
ncbi:MAG: PKD domain-containing protein [Bacteroidales bacterium]|nr:PKD domain-containing protein [Bacteroidales bacterium]